MRLALAAAATAPGHEDVPIGAVLARDDEPLATAVNERELRRDPTAHAEILALRRGAELLGGWRLPDTTLYVTLEPCAMCAGAIALARLDAVRFGAEDPKGGGVVHGARLFSQPTCHHRPDVLGGIGEQESSELLKRFFEERR